MLFYWLQTLCNDVDIGASESFLRAGELPTLIVQSTGHALHVFINGQLSGTLPNNFILEVYLVTCRPFKQICAEM